MKQSSRVVILVKAFPNPSRKYGETVCCAGVTPDRKWKRLYPVRFRFFQQSTFTRWDWVKFDYRIPTSDKRRESCHVYEDSISVEEKPLKAAERIGLLESLVRGSTRQAAAEGSSLTLVRPQNSRFIYRRKSADVIEAERVGY